MTLKESFVIATSTFKCDLCDYENHTKKGLSCHIAQKHKEKQQEGVPSPIPQLDGRYDDIVEPAKEDPKFQLAKGGYSCSEFKLKFEGSTAYGLRPTNDHTVCMRHAQALASSTLHLRQSNIVFLHCCRQMNCNQTLHPIPVQEHPPIYFTNQDLFVRLKYR